MASAASIGERERRLALNEAHFREINESLQEAATRFGGDDHLYDYLCECSNRGCDLHLEATISEYEAVRAHPDRFLLALGHELPDIERVVAANDRYAVVEKTPAQVSMIVALLDPRRAETPA